jgi:hypothetical protein
MENKKTTNENLSLTIKIDYKDDISLSEFKETIEGLNNQYNSFLSQCNGDEKNDKLLIRAIKKECIILELASAIIPLISDINTVCTFYTSIKALFGWLSSRKGIKPKISISDLDNTKKIIAPVNNDDGRQITISIEGDNNAQIIIDSAVAKSIVQNADDEYLMLSKPIILSEIVENKENVIFRLTQIKDDEDSNKNTKGIIHEIDNKEHMILFSTGIKEKILQESRNPFRKNYLVDIKVTKVNNIIKSYTILDLHDSYIDEEYEGKDLFS